MNGSGGDGEKGSTVAATHRQFMILFGGPKINTFRMVGDSKSFLDKRLFQLSENMSFFELSERLLQSY